MKPIRSDEQLIDTVPDRRERRLGDRLRDVGQAARTDGARGLPARPPSRPGRRRRLSGNLPRAGARPAPSTIARSWAVGSTRWPTEPRSERGNVAPDPHRGWRFRRWKNLTRDPSTLRVATSSGCSFARRSMACPRSTACWCCTPTWKARATSRSPGCFGVRSAQSRGGCRGPATCCEPGCPGAAGTRTRSDIDGDDSPHRMPSERSAEVESDVPAPDPSDPVFPVYLNMTW